MIEPGITIESLSRVAPFGVRFWDYVTGSPIGDSLQVTAYAPANPDLPVRAITNRSAVYMLYGLPGLRSFEFGSGDAQFWAAPRATRTFTIAVSDSQNRFIPFSFKADMPFRGLFGLQCGAPGSPPNGPAVVPLYSSPARSVPGAMAVVRAELHVPLPSATGVGEPAAWALVEAQIDGNSTVRGIADQKGRVALIFPYPEPVAVSPMSPPGSPPSTGGGDLRQQHWPIRLRAAYLPSRPVPAMADLCSALNQPGARLWADSAISVPLESATLQFGKELILRSVNASTREPLSVVFITPAGSPP